MTLTQTRVSDVAVLPLVSVEGRLVFNDAVGVVPTPPAALPSDPRWILDAFRRPTRVGGQVVRIYTEGGWIVGMGLARHARELPDGLARQVAVGLPRGCQDQSWTAVVGEDGTVAFTSEAPRSPRTLRLLHRIATDPRDTVSDRWSFRVRSLVGHEQRQWLVHAAPVARLAVPRFACLSRTQLDVCALAALGYSAREIAAQGQRSLETVRSHLRAAYRRLGVANRVELVPVIDQWDAWSTQLPQGLMAQWVRASSALSSPGCRQQTTYPRPSLR